MATTTGDEPGRKHWLGVLLAILVTIGIGAIIPTILYLL